MINKDENTLFNVELPGTKKNDASFTCTGIYRGPSNNQVSFVKYINTSKETCTLHDCIQVKKKNYAHHN